VRSLNLARATRAMMRATTKLASQTVFTPFVGSVIAVSAALRSCSRASRPIRAWRRFGHATGHVDDDMRARRWSFLLAAALALAATARAQGEDDLVELINARRAEPADCAGKLRPAASPLAPSAALAEVDAKTSAELARGLSAVGYLASTAATIIVSGPRDANEALRQVEQHYCSSLLDARYSDIGVSRSGTTWRINIARPLIARDLGDWHQAGVAVLRLVNEARATPRACGARSFAAAPQLAWSDALAQVALVHSRDMAARNYFDHVDPAGATVAQRATRAGYRWQVVGENIAAGQGSARQVVAGWLASPGHCENIMSREFVDMGAAYAINPHSAMEIYWTQTFGAR